ncbi:MAG: D-2-hydroxyacid dehydrogenase [Muribaculaceae bacterium]|nr:D-2-hydroxyacid dehydrogenase [Muribaculaceae bacterium]
MNITILDGYSINPGDLDWSDLASMGTLTVYDRTLPAEVLDRARDSEILLTNKVALDSDIINALPHLRYIGILATGYNIVDIRVARLRGIPVSNVPSYSTMSVAQSVFALLLAFTNSTEHYSDEFHHGEWCRCPDFCFVNTDLTELAGKRLGIIGYGHIGKAVAQIGAAFGMQVCASSSKPQSEIPEVEKQTIDEIFTTCDVVSLHCPLTDDTYHLADARRIALMKPDAILINTARGPLVDEAALANALRQGKIRGAGLDVLGQEPPAAYNPLIGAPRCIVTPHIAWATKEARRRLIDIASANVRHFLAGDPQNIVN